MSVRLIEKRKPKHHCGLILLMPSISQPFRLASLPRLSALTDTTVQADNIQVADDLSPVPNKITIGISESAISQYILNPTPKLVLSIPIPTTNVVTACDVSQFEDSETTRLQEIWCYGLKAGKNNILNVSVNDFDAESVLNSSGELNNLKKIQVRDEVVNIKIMNRVIIVVLKSGLIQVFDFELRLVHSLDISYANVTIVNHFKEDNGHYMFVMCSLNDDKVCFKLFDLNAENNSTSPVKELSSIILEDFSIAKSKICYQSGKLYRLVEDRMTTYSLPHFQVLQTVVIPMITKKQVISLKPVSLNRLLLTLDNKVLLLDLMHNSILSERELTHVKTFQILKSAVINSEQGMHASSNKTIAIGVATKQGVNSSASLEILNVDVGTGTLKDSLGKSFQTVIKNKATNGLKLLFDDEEVEGMNCDKDEKDQANFDFEDIYQQLVKCKKHISNFDDVFSTELRIKKEHYTEEDRFICDPKFLRKVIELIFENFNKEYPKALTFLLTHPLFPIECTKNLLARLSEHPRLFKQAIVTCPNLPLNELLFELFSIQNGELSLDISLRILQDYTKDMVRDEIKKLSKVEVHNFIEFIMNSRDNETARNGSQLFQLLALILDSIGLLTLEGTILNRLSDFIDEQINITERNTKLWYLLDNKQVPRSGTQSSYGSKIQKELPPKYTVEYLEL